MKGITLEDLPDQAREIAGVVGLDDTLRIVSVYGGMALSFSDDTQGEVGTRRDIITQLLGKKKATAFFRRFVNRILYIPRCASALKKVRDVEICQKYDRATTIAELVGEYRLTERQIWNILKESADKQ
jgi:hypothetical protein